MRRTQVDRSHRRSMDALTRRLAEVSLLDSAYNILGEAIYLPRYPASSSPGEVFIFGNGARSKLGVTDCAGSFVTWAVPKAAAEDLLLFVIRGGAGDVEKNPYRDEQTESCDFVVSQTCALTTPTALTGQNRSINARQCHRAAALALG